GSNRLLAFDYANFGINYFHYFPISIKNKGVNSRQINKTITKTAFAITSVTNKATLITTIESSRFRLHLQN
ncbi:hypothetical protein, partial [Vibrio sp. 10N.222.54.B11]|uniref:hypothetical protein n=1 Tax=Vibrio sp. 10N.222.54.B11 TaxID=3229635 RepID=UPI00355305B5